MSVLARHFRHHVRFYGSVLVGGAVWLATPGFDASVRLLLAGDALFATFIVTMGTLALRSQHETFVERVRREDEGIVVVALITAVTIVVTLGSVFAMLDRADHPHAGLFALSLASVPLGWFMVHLVFAFHYANAYYSPPREGGDAGGLSFPGGGEPRAWDFLYYAFVVAMTAQVSDVSVVSTRMRRLTLAHGVISFFFNTVLLAIAVNVTVSLVGG